MPEQMPDARTDARLPVCPFAGDRMPEDAGLPDDLGFFDFGDYTRRRFPINEHQ